MLSRLIKDDFDEVVVSARCVMDRARTLKGAARKLVEYARYLQTLSDRGWELKDPVYDDNGFLKYNKENDPHPCPDFQNVYYRISPSRHPGKPNAPEGTYRTVVEARNGRIWTQEQIWDPDRETWNLYASYETLVLDDVFWVLKREQPFDSILETYPLAKQIGISS